jgi:hypothetical protein
VLPAKGERFVGEAIEEAMVGSKVGTEAVVLLRMGSQLFEGMAKHIKEAVDELGSIHIALVGAKEFALLLEAVETMTVVGTRSEIT